ncbi:MAG: ATP-binding cassette domain-containing protein [Chlorobi bacterium]|nr:ATP-binding cassette domain-containing protein [Chlorobiota bacterium]
MTETYIEVKNLTKRFGEQIAVDNITFSVNKGEVVGFLGPNGAGKSTTMRMLVGYYIPTDGVAKILGYDCIEQSLEVRKHTGYLPENNPLYYDMYVKEFLLFMAYSQKISKPSQRLKEVIDLTGLGPEQHKQIGHLSRGYKQRVGLAHALLHDPEVLILDEPTSGLDPNQVIEIRNLIRELGKERTILLSTHIMQEVEQVCSRVIIINKGRIVADGDPAHLKKTIFSRRKFRLEIKEKIKGTPQVLRKWYVEPISPGHWFIYSSSEEDIRPELYELCVENNWTLLTLVEEEQPLEEVFHKLTMGS